MRYLILILLVVAAILVLRALSRRTRDEAADVPPVGNMVRCARCGVYLPESEAIRAGDDFYCSAEHRDQAAPR